MKRTLQISLSVIFVFTLSAITVLTLNRPNGVRGKSPALPITDQVSPEDQLAQDLALTDPEVIALTTGRRSEVFTIVPTGAQLTEAAQDCRRSDCRQVNIYNFEENETIAVLVDVTNQRVMDVLVMTDMHPPGNARLLEVAVDVIMNAPEVAAELGRTPAREEIYPMPSSLVGTDCGSIHPCLGSTFPVGDRVLWAHVDLTTETFAGIAWSTNPGPDGRSEEFIRTGGCPPAGEVMRDGWNLDYEVTPSDGLRVFDVNYQGIVVMSNAKLAEWHVDYGNSGFLDATGCSPSSGFPIFPFGNTQVLDLLDNDENVIGFEVVQDFRMSNWGANCNYRYEQHFQFFADGRFRVVGGAYGRGCGSDALYRPLVRIDIAVGGNPNDQFAVWNGTLWAPETEEFWALQDDTLTPEGYAWKVSNPGLGVYGEEFGFYIEPGQGQFNDGGLGDDAFIYVVRFQPSEGSADLTTVGTCCNDNEQQGPHNYINGESIDGQNIVIWYVPQMDTIVGGNDPEYYCWTVSGDPNPEAYPCFGGPMFHWFGFGFPVNYKIHLPITIDE